jgi:ribosomal-protein-alanine N-acetyltransferase
MLDLNFEPFPELWTERLRLRPITEEDCADMFELRSNPQLMRYIDRPLAQGLEDARKLIDSMEAARRTNDSIAWGLVLRESTKLIGTIAYWRIAKEHHRAEIGYLLHPGWQNRGLMSEALEVALDFGFRQMRLHSVEANVNPDNEASIRLLEKIGFVREAYFRENYYFNGKFLDSAIYSKLTPIR